MVTLQNSVQNGLKCCKSSCQEVVSDFATNAPDPSHWTLKACFSAFCTIWAHLGQCGCVTKLSAEWAQLVQKFVPRSRFGIFRNEHTRSNPLDSKLMFWCVLYYLDAWHRLVALQNSVQNGPKGCKSSCHEVASYIFRNEHTRLTPLRPKLMFCCVLYYLGAFGMVWWPYKTRCKTEVVQKFMP